MLIHELQHDYLLWQWAACCPRGEAEHSRATRADACVWSNAPWSVWSADPLTIAVGMALCVTDVNLSQCLCVCVSVRERERGRGSSSLPLPVKDTCGYWIRRFWIIDKWLCSCSNELAVYYKHEEQPTAVNYCSLFSQCQYPVFSRVCIYAYFIKAMFYWCASLVCGLLFFYNN